MDGEDQPKIPLTPLAPAGIDTRMQVDNALRAIHQKKPVPEIDFTLHTMEDGSQVSTMERVCKGMVSSKMRNYQKVMLNIYVCRCTSTCHDSTNRSTVLLATGSIQAKFTILEATFLQRRSLDRGTGSVHS